MSFDATRLSMPTWQLVKQESSGAHWRDAAGDVIAITWTSEQWLTPTADVAGLRKLCRSLAESQRAGLVEVVRATAADGPCLTYIYKKKEKRGLRFFGVAVVPIVTETFTWLVQASERGEAKQREATVADRLMASGQLTPESRKTRWHADPYDPSYAGVDRDCLCCVSDAAEYDAEFPDHALTKTRRELRRLLRIALVPPPVDPAKQLEDARRLLGVAPSASLHEIDVAFRKVRAKARAEARNAPSVVQRDIEARIHELTEAHRLLRSS